MRFGLSIQMRDEMQQICTVCLRHCGPVPSRPERLAQLWHLHGDARFAICCCCLQPADRNLQSEQAYRSRWVDWVFAHAPYCLQGLAENRVKQEPPGGPPH